MNGRIVKLFLAALLALLGPVAHASGTVTYVYTDPQGTPLVEADASGTITATFDYKPYGSQALGSPKAGPGYTGHVNDPDTGFVYMQARYYDPVVGRFLSVDLVDVKEGDVFSYGRFLYANNNPIMRTDPDGRDNVLGVVARLPEDIRNPTASDLSVQAAAQRSVDLTVRAVMQGGTDEERQNASRWSVTVDPRMTLTPTGGIASTAADSVSTMYSAAIGLVAESQGEWTFAGGVQAPGGDSGLFVVGAHELGHTTRENRAIPPGPEKEANASKHAIELSNSSPDVKPESIKKTTENITK